MAETVFTSIFSLVRFVSAIKKRHWNTVNSIDKQTAKNTNKAKAMCYRERLPQICLFFPKNNSNKEMPKDESP